MFYVSTPAFAFLRGTCKEIHMESHEVFYIVNIILSLTSQIYDTIRAAHKWHVRVDE